jgi:hypothetical protein
MHLSDSHTSGRSPNCASHRPASDPRRQPSRCSSRSLQSPAQEKPGSAIGVAATVWLLAWQNLTRSGVAVEDLLSEACSSGLAGFTWQPGRALCSWAQPPPPAAHPQGRRRGAPGSPRPGATPPVWKQKRKESITPVQPYCLPVKLRGHSTCVLETQHQKTRC